MSDITVVVTYRNHLTAGELWRGTPAEIHKIPNTFARNIAEDALKKKKQCSGGQWTVRLLGTIDENEDLWPPKKEEAATQTNIDNAPLEEKKEDPTDVFEQSASDPTDVFDAATNDASDEVKDTPPSEPKE